jgi:L-ribulose-5-phosphate 3-epimerase
MGVIRIGINARLFPSNWRPLLREIEFSKAHGFEAIQILGKEEGLNAGHLGDSVDVVRDALLGLMPVMEIVIPLNEMGKTTLGHPPIEIFKANIEAITLLAVQHVHWHLTPIDEPFPLHINEKLEEALIPQFEEAVAIAQQHRFKFAFEHNEPDLRLFGEPESCAKLLHAVSGLGFVWDFNHTEPEHLAAFKSLIPRMTMLHISDTPLPEVNYHLPLGMGNVPFVDYARTLPGFDGAAILEIGGLPKSGGYGRDTDEALIDSKRRLAEAISEARVYF